MIPLFVLAAIAYGAASFAYGAAAGGREDEDVGPPVAPRLLLAGAAVLHLSTIGAQCVVGDHPFKSIFLVTSLGVWVAVVGYLLIANKHRPMRALGAVLAPVGLVGLTLSVVLGPSNGGLVTGTDNALLNPLLRAHVALATLGLAGFFLAAGVAGLYLAMDRRLRAKKFRPGGGQMSLSGLESLQYWLTVLVTPVFTLSVIAGAVFALRSGGVDLMLSRTTELTAAAVAWLASLAVLFSRLAWGLRGRKAAWLTMVSFVSMVLIVVSYGLRGG